MCFPSFFWPFNTPRPSSLSGQSTKFTRSNLSMPSTYEAKALPLHSFHINQESLPLDQLTRDNAFAFRVWIRPDPSKSPTTNAMLPETIRLKGPDGFVARAFEHMQGSQLTAEITHHLFKIPSPDNRKKHSVLKHVDRRYQHYHYGEKGESPYVSTSLSLIWAIHNALWYENYHTLSAAVICITVIRIAKLDQRPDALVVAGAYMDQSHDARPFAIQAQEVLVYGRIHSEAVVSTVTLQQLRDSNGLPTWMTLQSVPQSYRWGKMRWGTAKEYAVYWAGRMRGESDTERCVIKLALAVLGVDFTPGNRLKRDGYAMLTYLLQWPFRRQPGCLKVETRAVGSVMMTRVLKAWEEFG
ncbi:hypothetical protein BDV98DRAFT_607340 [Pterulicium gracile]|uniref:DUF7587 domain-containing protein n=1 Tax=Pterulicium gracile TaxID=1884261 RepID=A0A5C3Q7A1_9AGAR|nr:hypothetical protein BDV98DRAFT_607340 [Pterula gracilis]